MQSIIGTFSLTVSVSASACGVYPDVELVAELPEDDFLNPSSTQLSVVQVRRVNYGDSPPCPWPAIGVATVTGVAEPFSVDFEGPDDESVAHLAVDTTTPRRDHHNCMPLTKLSPALRLRGCRQIVTTAESFDSITKS